MLYMKDLSKRYEWMSTECQRQQLDLQLLAPGYRVDRTVLINSIYPSVFFDLASVDIHFRLGHGRRQSARLGWGVSKAECSEEIEGNA